MKVSFKQFASIFFILLMVQACGSGDDRFNVRLTPPDPYDLSSAVKDSTTEDGLKIYVIEEGSGRSEVNFRDQVRVRYTGRIEENGDVFDSTFRNDRTNPRVLQNLTPVPKPGGNRPIEPLVDGFRRGLLGMKEGEKRVLIIPPELGYGKSEENDTGSRLQDKTLRFDVELVEILE